MQRRRPQLRRRHPLELLWPFLLLILIGVIVVLLVQFVMTWFDQRQTELRNKMYFYLDRGVASVLPWGQTEWAKAYHGQLVLAGDVLRTGKLSRGVLAFFDASVARMGSDTKLEIDSIEPMDRGEGDLVKLVLSTGELWLATSDSAGASSGPLQFVVNTDHLRITSYGTVFEVTSTDRETVRVMEGEALVEILEEGKGRDVVIDQVKVGVGQEIEVTASDLEAIYARQPVSLLAALSDEWKAGEWYAWNRIEDVMPTVFGEAELAQESSTEGVAADVADSEVAEDATVATEPPTVAITSPSESLVVFKGKKDEAFTISGTASATTSKVIVTSYDASGTAAPYVLKSYEAGAAEWSYRAAYAYGNLREGRNRFTVMGEDKDGVKSAAVEVIVEVPVGTFEAKDEVADEDAEVSEEGVDETETDSEATPEAVSTIEEPLTPPRVVSVNGAALPADARLTTSSESVTVVGAVSASTSVVYVNNFKLTKYVAGSGEWSYVMRADFGNYDAGNNTYTVVAEDAEGNKESFVFEVYRVAP